MASKRGQRRRRCTGKRTYESEEHAINDARRMRWQQKRSDIDAYRCPHCGGIHVGHRPMRHAPAPKV
jgi:hypothetical protein